MQAWRQNRLDPARLLLIDESWARIDTKCTHGHYVAFRVADVTVPTMLFA